MSTKIYDAYIIPIEGLNAALKEARQRIHRRIAALLQPVYQAVDESPVLTSLDFWSLLIADQRSRMHGFFDEVGARVWLDGDQALVRFYGVDSRFNWGNGYIPDAFRDYHYQNSTDKPEGVTEKEWCVMGWNHDGYAAAQGLGWLPPGPCECDHCIQESDT